MDIQGRHLRAAGLICFLFYGLLCPISCTDANENEVDTFKDIKDRYVKAVQKEMDQKIKDHQAQFAKFRNNPMPLIGDLLSISEILIDDLEELYRKDIETLESIYEYLQGGNEKESVENLMSTYGITPSTLAYSVEGKLGKRRSGCFRTILEDRGFNLVK